MAKLETSHTVSSKVVGRSQKTVYGILFTISMIHLLNDTIQAVVPAIFPIIEETLSLSFAQLGLITLGLNVTASLLQPIVGMYSDKHPRPYLLPLGMCSTFCGIVGMAFADGFWTMFLSVMMVGIGSAVFHPESAKVAYLAAGNRRGLAQSIFQVGGNSGQALAPVMTALIFVPLGQFGIIWFTFAAGMAIILQIFIARWYSAQLALYPAMPNKKNTNESAHVKTNTGQQRKVYFAVGVLVLLVASKTAYLSGITSFYSFFLIDQFGLSVKHAQWCLFAFMGAGALGTFLGGPLADRFGRRNMIWFSILGALPFAIALPYMNLWISVVFLVIIGLTIMSSGSVVVVYAQEMLPKNVGTISGLFYGLSFGIGGLSAAALGVLGDATSIKFMIQVSAIFPILGLLTVLLPSDQKLRQWTKTEQDI